MGDGEGLLVGAVGVEGEQEGGGGREEVEGEVEGLGFLLAVESADAPVVAAASGDDEVFAGIACQEAGLVPGHWHLHHMPLCLVGQGVETLGTVGPVLDARFESY